MFAVILVVAGTLLFEPLDINGSVVDEQGQPVAEATVVLVHSSEANKDVTVETDAEGNFTLTPVGSEERSVQLLAWKSGYDAGVLRTDYRIKSYGVEFGTNPGSQIRITLRSLIPKQIVVVDAKNTPQSNVKVIPTIVGEGSQFVYRDNGLPDLLSTTSNNNGQVDMLLNGGAFLAVSKGLGTQRFYLNPANAASTERVTLSDTEVLNGKVIADNPTAREGWKIVATGVADKEASEPDSTVVKCQGVGKAVSAADGSFQIPMLAAGKYRISASHAELKKYQVNFMQIEVSAGQAVSVELQTINQRRAFGRIVREGTNEPVVGAKLYFGGVAAVSDDSGVFEGYVSKAPATVRINQAPDGYVVPSFDSRPVEIANADASEFDLGTIAIKGAATIQGIVANEDGEPQSGMTVQASWTQRSQGSSFSFMSDSCLTDSNGNYQLLNTPGDVPVHVSAFGNEAATAEPVQLVVSAERELDLRVSPDHVAYLTAVVNDAKGQPIANAKIRFTQELRTPEHNMLGGRSVRIAGEDSLATSAAGQIRTTVRLPRAEAYSLAISADGFLPLKTDYKQLIGTGSEAKIGEFTLQQAKTAAGIVVDLAGAPVSGMKVTAHGIPEPEGRGTSQPTVIDVTGADGRFMLTPLHPATAVVTIRADGWRPGGGVIPANDGPLSITAVRVGEGIPEAQLVSVPPQQEQRIQAGTGLLDSMLPEVRKSRYFYDQLLELMARVNADKLVEELPRSSNHKAKVKALIAMQEYEEADAEAEQIKDGYGRAYARFEIIKASPDKDQKLQMIAAAMLDAKSIQQPDRRAVVVAGVADQLIAVGEHAQAEALLTDSLDQFKQLPASEWGGFAKGFFAERLARYNLDAAMALLEEMEPRSLARHSGNMAHALASLFPEQAEKIVANSDATRSVVAYRIRVCYRMAAVDLERAESVRQGHPDNQSNFAKQHSLGVMAMAVHMSDPGRAKQLLQQAWTELESAVQTKRGNSSSGVYSFGVATALANYTQKINPDGLTDAFWRTVAMYPGPQGNSWQPENQEIEDLERQAMLVLLFGLYNREPQMCQRLMEPAFEYWSKKTNLEDNDFYRKTATFAGMAVADPQRAADWAAEAHKMMPKKSRSLIPQPWVTVAQTLCNDIGQIHDMLADEVFHHWIIDKYDL